MTKRAVLYARVSTDDQADKGYSLPSQLEACRKYAERQGFTTAAWFTEDYSGATRIAERPEGKKLMAMLCAQQADAVIVYQVDRLSRDIVDLLASVQAWIRAGIEIHTCDIGRIESELDIVLVIKGWQGSDERKKIVERTARGKRHKAQLGKVVGIGRAPYGFRFTRDTNNRVVGLEIDEPTARIAQLILQWYVCGDESGKRLSIFAIGARLTGLKIPTPGDLRGIDKIGVHHKTKKELVLRRGVWSKSAVSNIINNEVYAGVWRYGRRIGEDGKGGRRPLAEQIAVSVPAIIDRETWERAQAQRRHNAVMSKRNAKHDYLLSGFMQCACGRSMSGSWDKRGKTSVRRYRCNSIGYHHRGEVCKEKTIIADAAEDHVWNRIKAKFSDLNGLWAELKAAQQEELDMQEPKRDALQAVEGLIQETDQEANEVAHALRQAKGRVSENLKRQQDEINARYDALTMRRDELKAELDARHLTDNALTEIAQFANDAKEGIEHATYDDKRRMLENLAVQVTVKDRQISDIRGLIGFGVSRSAHATRRRIGFARRIDHAPQARAAYRAGAGIFADASSICCPRVAHRSCGDSIGSSRTRGADELDQMRRGRIGLHPLWQLSLTSLDRE